MGCPQLDSSAPLMRLCTGANVGCLGGGYSVFETKTPSRFTSCKTHRKAEEL
jgi:hypothetical protein